MMKIIRIKNLVEEDFVNYKKPSMFVGTISCNGKCCIEANIPISVCQNDIWRACNALQVPCDTLCERYLRNPVTKAIVFGGLEPFEEFEDILLFIHTLRVDYTCNDDIVIYTGYNKDEILEQIETLKKYENIIIKFGRFVPNDESRYDEVLGVTLVSKNQYAERIS